MDSMPIVRVRKQIDLTIYFLNRRHDTVEDDRRTGSFNLELNTLRGDRLVLQKIQGTGHAYDKL